jgi:hypothetical protein
MTYYTDRGLHRRQFERKADETLDAHPGDCDAGVRITWDAPLSRLGCPEVDAVVHRHSAGQIDQPSLRR